MEDDINQGSRLMGHCNDDGGAKESSSNSNPEADVNPVVLQDARQPHNKAIHDAAKSASVGQKRKILKRYTDKTDFNFIFHCGASL